MKPKEYLLLAAVGSMILLTVIRLTTKEYTRQITADMNRVHQQQRARFINIIRLWILSVVGGAVVLYFIFYK